MGGAEVRGNTKAVCTPGKGHGGAQLKPFGGIKRRDTKCIQSLSPFFFFKLSNTYVFLMYY